MSITQKRLHFCCKMLSFQQLTQLNCVIAMENILTRANYFNLSDPTVVLYGRAGQGLEISKRNRGIPPLVQPLVSSPEFHLHPSPASLPAPANLSLCKHLTPDANLLPMVTMVTMVTMVPPTCRRRHARLRRMRSAGGVSVRWWGLGQLTSGAPAAST